MSSLHERGHVIQTHAMFLGCYSICSCSQTRCCEAALPIMKALRQSRNGAVVELVHEQVSVDFWRCVFVHE